ANGWLPCVCRDALYFYVCTLYHIYKFVKITALCAARKGTTMPEHKTRLMQMLANEQKRRDWTDRQCAEFLGELQQTFSTWKRGSLPRLPKPRLAAFLQISDDMLAELVQESRESTGSTKLPRLAAVREY